MTDRGICGLQFIEDENTDAALRAIRSQLPGANFIVDPKETGPIAEAIFRADKSNTSVSISVIGTNFQIRVWRALLSIPPGSLVSYGGLAKAMAMPKAARAVGSAIGANPVAYIIPCHRAIRATGLIDTNYRWGPARKLAMIGREAAKNATEETSQQP